MGGICPVLEHALVAGVARRLGQGAGQAPRQPVEEVAHHGGLFVDLGRHLEDLEDLRQEQLGGEHPAVAAQPPFAPGLGDLDQAGGLVLGAVVLPQLDVCVDVVLETGLLAQRHAVLVGEEHRGGGGVDADADDVGGVHTGGLDGRGHGFAQHLDVVGGVLQGEFGRERLVVAGGQGAVHDAVRVFGHVRAQLLACRGVDDDGAAGERSVVDADQVFLVGHGLSSPRRFQGVRVMRTDGGAGPRSPRARTASRRRRRRPRGRRGCPGPCSGRGSSGP